MFTRCMHAYVYAAGATVLLMCSDSGPGLGWRLKKRLEGRDEGQNKGRVMMYFKGDGSSLIAAPPVFQMCFLWGVVAVQVNSVH